MNEKLEAAVMRAGHQIEHLQHENHIQSAELVSCKETIQRLTAERDALRTALASSCDEEREQLWEACPGGGCSRALDAERELDELRDILDCFLSVSG